MDSGVLRDFIIVITGGLFTALLVLFSIVAFLLYRQLNSLIKSVKDTINSSKDIQIGIKDAIKSTRILTGMFMGQSTKEGDKPNMHMEN